MTQFGNQMKTVLFDHLQGIIVAKCPIIDKVDDLDMVPINRRKRVMVSSTKRRAADNSDSSSISILSALRSSPFPRGFFL